PAFDVWRDYLGLAAVVATLPPPPPPPRDATAATTATTATTTATTTAIFPRVCAFCKHNGEARAVYGGHSLRDAAGRLQCPVLRGYVCPQCGATQDGAHTKRFCPLTRRGYASVYTRGTGRAAARGGEK
ncbi:NANO3 protein, partial [Podargus strigoides]|nr:NANO3 protein [Podargus strigoides]